MSNTRCMITGETIPWRECLGCALAQGNDCGWDYVLLRAVKKHQEGHRAGYHVTGITGCLRKTWYYGFTEAGAKYPSDSIYTFLGTIIHSIMEGHDGEMITEIPLRSTFNDIELVGRADVYYTSGRLIDIKTAKRIYPHLLPYGSHVRQVQTYCLMLKRMGFPISSAAIQYIDKAGPSQCKKCKGNLKPGPEFECVRCGEIWQWTDDRGKRLHAGAMLYEVPLDPEETEVWVTQRLKTLDSAFYTETPPPGEPSKLCGYCDFKERCPDAQ